MKLVWCLNSFCNLYICGSLSVVNLNYHFAQFIKSCLNAKWDLNTRNKTFISKRLIISYSLMFESVFSIYIIVLKLYFPATCFFFPHVFSNLYLSHKIKGKWIFCVQISVKLGVEQNYVTPGLFITG